MEHCEVRAFVDATLAVRSFAELDILLADATRRLGFDHFALVHHVSCRAGPHRYVQLSNYPEAWVARHTGNNLLSEDPIVAACQRTATSFVWSDLERVIELTPRQRAILQDSQRFGLVNGFSVPINIPGDPPASASFSVPPGKDLPREHFAQAHYVACFAFEAGRRLCEAEAGPPKPVRLTPRQVDCIVHIARGKTDWETAHILGIRQDTVHQHVEAAKSRLGVTTRTQLIVAALHRKVIAMSDVVQ